MGTLGGVVGRGGGAGDIRRHAVAALSALNGSVGRTLTESKSTCEHRGMYEVFGDETRKWPNGYAVGSFLKVCLENSFRFNPLIAEQAM